MSRLHGHDSPAAKEPPESLEQQRSRGSGDSLPARDGSGAMFDRIARRYDLLNRLMSFGLDQKWREKTVRALALPENARVLDLASGTADLAIRVAERHPSARVTGVDPSRAMLEIGRQKLAARGLTERVTLVVGDAQALPQPDHSFDGVCMGFGIRNVPDRAKALAEIARVTRPGGRVAILELSEPRRGLLAPLTRFHIHVLVPRLGALLSGSREYRYLQRSIAAFPPAREFADMLEEAGLQVLEIQPMTLGTCHLYVATPRPSGPRPQGETI